MRRTSLVFPYIRAAAYADREDLELFYGLAGAMEYKRLVMFVRGAGL